MNNPYVNINRVIDGTPDQRRVVDFLHIRSVSEPFTIAATGFITPGVANLNGIEYYQFSDGQLENKLRLTHVPMIIIDKNSDATLDKNNFPTCYVENIAGEPKLILWSAAPMISGNVKIVSIILFEAGKTLGVGEITRGFTNGGGGSGSSGPVNLSDVTYDAATLVSYLNQLGNVAGDVDQIQAFLTGLSNGITTRTLTADFVKAGTIDATKLTIHGPNIITSFDSFEQFANKGLMGTTTGLTPTSFGLLSANVINTQKYHGDNSLRIQVDTGAAGWIYLNPYTFNRENWIRITKPGHYIFSFYEKCPSALLNVEVGKVSLTDVTIPETPVEKTFRTIVGTGSGDGTEGFIRRQINFNVADVIPATETEPLIPAEATEDNPLLLTLKVDLNASTICYLDAIQLEEAEDATSTAFPFSSGGETVISGDNIITGTIDATKVTVDNLNADNITAGFIDAARIDVNTITADKIAAGSITSDKIVANAITSDKIIANAITSDKITTNAITSDKIVANAITSDKIVANGISTRELAAESVTTEKIKALAITSALINAEAITADKIESGTITANQIATDIITAATAIIAVGAIQNAQIADASITNAKIIDLSADKINVGLLNADRIATGSLSAQKITGGTITSDKLYTGEIEVGTGRIINAAITSAVINDAAITSAKIIDGAITNAKIDNLSAGKITTGTLDAARIATNSLDANRIAVGTITANLINTTDLFVTNNIFANRVFIKNANIENATIEFGKIKSIDAQTISVNKIIGSQIAANTINASNIDVVNLAASTAWVGQAFIDEGNIKQLTSFNSFINNLDAGKITTGTLSAERIVFRDPIHPEYSVLFKLNSQALRQQIGEPVDPFLGMVWLNTVTNIYKKYNGIDWSSSPEVDFRAAFSTETFDASVITPETIYGDLIQAGAITTGKIVVTDQEGLSALNANIGTITAGMLQSGTDPNPTSYLNLNTGAFKLGDQLSYDPVLNTINFASGAIDFSSLSGDTKTRIEAVETASGENSLKFSLLNNTANIITQESEPSNPIKGDFWKQISTGILKTYTGTQWVLSNDSYLTNLGQTFSFTTSGLVFKDPLGGISTVSLKIKNNSIEFIGDQSLAFFTPTELQVPKITISAGTVSDSLIIGNIKITPRPGSGMQFTWIG